MSPDLESIFVIYFASVAGIQFHPRNDFANVDLEVCAAEAMQMLRIHMRLWPKTVGRDD